MLGAEDAKQEDAFSILGYPVILAIEYGGKIRISLFGQLRLPLIEEWEELFRYQSRHVLQEQILRLLGEDGPTALP